MNYVSTRGTAPVLGFEEAMLAGLARDGGLYLPETWPTLAPDEIAALAGLSYEDAALRILAPFTGDAFPEAALRPLIARAYAGFGHAARVPLVQIAPNDWLLELFHGPTLAFKDVAMQLIGQLFEASLKRSGKRITIVGATSGDTGSAAIEAFRGAEGVEVFILFPDGRTSEVQRRQMTTPTEGNVHALAIAGDFDDAQARVKDMFNDHPFRDGTGLAGVNSINWARVLAQTVYYFTAAVALGAPHRKVSFTVPTGNFGDVFAGWVAKRMGLPIDRLVVATNQNDILHRTLETGEYRRGTVLPSISPSMDIQVSSNFERLLFELYDREGTAVSALMTELSRDNGFRLVPGRARPAPRRLRQRPRLRGRDRRRHRRDLQDDRRGRLPAHRRRHPCRAGEARRPGRADGDPRHRPPGEVPRRRRGRLRRPPAASPAHGRPDDAAGTDHARRQRPRRHRGRDRPGDCTMTVETHTLPNGVRLAVEPMPGLRSASVGIYLAAGGRHERAEQNGIAHFLEHMAFKGTPTRTALRIAEEIEDVGGYINAYTGKEMTAYYARVLEADVGRALDILADIVLNPLFQKPDIEVERGVILQEIGQALDTPDDIIFDWLQETAFPDQPFGRTILGPTERVSRFGKTDLSGFVSEHYGPDRIIIAAAGGVDPEALLRDVERLFGGIAPRPRLAVTPARFAGGERREARDLEQVHLALAFEGPGVRHEDAFVAQIYATAMGGGMSSRLFQELRERRGLCYTIFTQAGAYDDTGMITLYAGTGGDQIRELTELAMDEIRRAADGLTVAELERSRAQLKAGLLMGLESPSARAERLARMLQVWGRVQDIDETIAKIDAVTPERLRAFAERLAERADPAVALLGPVDDAPDREALARRLAA